MIYVFERAPELEEIVADDEEQARTILREYFGRVDMHHWTLIDVRGQLPAEHKEFA